MSVKTILHVKDIAHARILIPALKSHGFHPIEGTDIGLSGMGGLVEPKGVAINVPEHEADDAQILAQALLVDLLTD